MSASAPLLVAVHGATGAQGAPVVQALLARGHQVRAITRTARADRLHEEVEVVASDLTDVNALVEAYRAVDAALLVLPGGAADEVAVRQADTILAALSKAGVPRAVFNAGGGIWKNPPAIPFLQARTRLAFGLPKVVQHASVVGPASTLMENFSEGWIVERLRETEELVGMAPPHAKMNPVAMADLAEVMAEVLGEDTPPSRVIVRGPAEVTGEEVAATIAAHLGKPVRYATLSPEEYLRGVAQGLGAQYAANIGSLYGSAVKVTPPDAPGPDARLVTVTTTLKAWISSQHWA